MAKEKMTISERFEYIRMMQERYQGAIRSRKAELLNEMETMTGVLRKYLIVRMNSSNLVRQKRRRQRQRVYGTEVIEALTTIADMPNWICAERL
jgi:hypothetical protein